MRTRVDTLLLLLLVNAVPAVCEGGAAAELASDIEDIALESLLNVTVSTATKSEQTLEESAGIATVFSRAELDRLGVRLLSDLLQYVPGFYEVSAQLDRNFAVRGVHGFAAQHFVVLIDGLAVNDFVFSAASPDTLCLDYAERVEIIRGPGSAIYGASALMAVVNIITPSRAADLSSTETLTIGSQGYLRNTLTFNNDITPRDNLLVAASLYKSDGYGAKLGAEHDVLVPRVGQNLSDGIGPGENLSAPRANAPLRVNRYGPSFDFFLKYARDNVTAIRMNVSQTDFRLQRTHRQGMVRSARESEPPRYVNRRLTLDVERRWGSIADLGQLALRTAFQVFSHDMRSQSISRDFYADAARDQGQAVISAWRGNDARLGASLEYAVDVPDLSLFRGLNVLAGVQVEYDVAFDYTMSRCFVDSNGNMLPSRYEASQDEQADLYCVQAMFLNEGVTTDVYDEVIRRYDPPALGDGDELRTGLFVQLSTLLPGDVNLVLGGRTDHEAGYGLQFSPRVALAAPLLWGVYAKVQYARAFVYPAFVFRTGNVISSYAGNPDVEPQYVSTREVLLGVKKGFLRVELNGYLNHVRDFITYGVERNARDGKYSFDNKGQLSVVGIENSTVLTLLAGRLTVRANAALARPLDSTDEQFMIDGRLGGATTYPEWMGTLMVTVAPFATASVTASARYCGTVAHDIVMDVTFADVEGTDGQVYTSKSATDYDTEALFVDVAGRMELLDAWVLGFSVSNLLDQRRFRPGAVQVPHLREGRLFTTSVGYQY